VTWRATGVAADTLGPGQLREVLIGGTSVLLARVGERTYALEALCPHLGGILSDGTLVDARLTCPEHQAVFEVRTGEVVADPFGLEPPEGGVEPVRSYPVRSETGMIEVDLP
jgi:nitrite reductase/ring-hydroxylating ferredoxin subunit